MGRLLLKLAIVAGVASSLFWLPEAVQQRGQGVGVPQTVVVRQQPAGAEAPPDSNPPAVPVLSPGQKAAHVEITAGPALELARDDLAIVRWTTNNPGGTDDHFAVIFYGTSPTALNQTAQNHIRLNPAHPDTTFRVRVTGLQPQTTYYYSVTSTESNGTSDGAQSAVSQFTTPQPGE